MCFEFKLSRFLLLEIESYIYFIILKLTNFKKNPGISLRFQ